MKLIYLLLVTAFTVSCKNNKTVTHTVKNDDGSTITTTMDLAGIENAAEDMTAKTEQLKKMTPLTLDQLKSMLPEAINGIKRTGYSTNSAMALRLPKQCMKKTLTRILSW